MRLYNALPLASLQVAAFLLLPFEAFCQEPKKTVPDGTEGERLEILDSSSTTKQKKPFNHFNLGFTTFKIGVAFLYEYAGFSHDAALDKQLDSAKADLESGFDIRDFRFLLSGKFNTKRTITWKVGLMYDGSIDTWFVRESGFTIDVPEWRSHFFIGRTKEGVSMSKVMSGYAVEGMERYMASDPIQILADGIKWMAYLPKSRIFWNLGIYEDWVNKKQAISTYSWQFAARVGWLPIHSKDSKTNLHLAVNYRFGQPDDNKVRLKSRPEANPAPFFIDTGEFPSNQSVFIGGEVYYNTGPLMLGTEYTWDKFNSNTTNDPVFHGGEFVASYMFGGARPYSTDGGNIYGYIPVKKPVFKGGLGVLEVLLRYSVFDLNGGTLRGGKFWRLTPMVNWYLNDLLRLELAYGHGILERYNTKGTTNILQARVQFMLR